MPHQTRSSYAPSVASAGYYPGHAAPTICQLEENRSLKNWPILQFSHGGAKGLKPEDAPNSVAKRGKGYRPAYYTQILGRKPTTSEMCMEEIGKALRTQDIKELQKAYKCCFADDRKQVCKVTTRDLRPLQRMIRNHHNRALEDAIGEDDKNKIVKAIDAAEKEEALIESVADGEPIILCRPPKLAEAKMLLDKILKKEMREAEMEKEQQEPPKHMASSTPEANSTPASPVTSRPITPEPNFVSEKSDPPKEEVDTPQAVVNDSKSPEKPTEDEAVVDPSNETAKAMDSSIEPAKQSTTITPSPRVAETPAVGEDQHVVTTGALPPRAQKLAEAKRQQDSKVESPPPEENPPE